MAVTKLALRDQNAAMAGQDLAGLGLGFRALLSIPNRAGLDHKTTASLCRLFPREKRRIQIYTRYESPDLDASQSSPHILHSR